MTQLDSALPLSILDMLPNPVMVKGADLKYVWINKAFESLFSVSREEVIGQLDKQLFPDRQVAQCSGGDMRVLSTGEVDEAAETVFREDGVPRETITRKIRLDVGDGKVFLVGLMHDVTDVTRANEALEANKIRLEQQACELARLATTDALTGCSNRRMLSDCGHRLFESATAPSAALMMLDVDHFKRINDTYGHECGDDVLRHFCTLVRAELSPNDFFIRLGGEEFAVCMEAESEQQVFELGESIRRCISDTPLVSGGASIDFTVSIGVSFKPTGMATTIESMLARADTALYQAKTGGRNQVVKAA